MRPYLVIMWVFLSCSPDEKDEDVIPPADAQITSRVVTSDVTHVWEMVWGPDGFLWVTERGGKISRVNVATGVKSVIYIVPDVVPIGEGGLLGMVLHPAFPLQPYLYIVYNYNESAGYREKVVRYTYQSGTLVNPFVLLDNLMASAIHNGSRLLIHNNYLYMTTGDAGDRTHPQLTSSLNGKVLRMNLDGSVPADNPIAGSRIWSKGHRNAQGLVFVNDKLFSSEHGTTTDDEINIIVKGGNYGWPDVEGFCDQPSEQTFCNANPVKEPLKVWTPTVAFSGMDHYNSDKIPQWKNSLLVTTLENKRLFVMKLNDNQDQLGEIKEYFANEFGRLRDICISPDGKVYIGTTNGTNDKIIEVSGN